MLEIPNNTRYLDFKIKLSSCVNTKNKSFKNKEIIVSNNDQERQIGFITYGKATIIKTDINGNTTIMRELKENDIFSNLFFQDSEDDIHIVSNGETDTIIIDYYTILKDCDRNCQIHRDLLTDLFDLLIKDNKKQNEKIELLSQKTVRNKFLYFLRQRINKDKVFKVTTSYKAIAEYIVVDRTNLMREIKKLEKEKIIKKEKRTIYLLK